jgi:L-2-hydroxycarboxylate dehydrogenase (NAD+)
MDTSKVAAAKTETSHGDVERVPAQVLAAFVCRALTAAGLPDDDAAIVADLIVEADLRGSEAQGVIRLPNYLRRLAAGGTNPRPNIRLVDERPATALVDGDDGMGYLVMRVAAVTAIEKARRNGLAWVGARMSNHAGPGGIYAMLPLAHDMIGLYLAVGSGNHLPPWGSNENLLGTNPLAVAIPTDEEPPIVLDMAPTVASYGRVRLRAQLGGPLPVGWMVDRNGTPLTDPNFADEGQLLPIGDYKGYGLSLVIGLLAGTLNRAAFARDIVDHVLQPGTTTNTGHAIIAVAVDAFMPATEFKRQVDGVVRTMRSARPMSGVERIWLPGERSHRERQERSKHGIPIPRPLRESLAAAAHELRIDPLC